uniref:Peptidase M14 domain-containing protein n=1 Tax=Timema tahoe TaxID=61484 RepID=A0A7R9IGN2_9NEOP|nr:unnamed protein product [Timema tahoe]
MFSLTMNPNQLKLLWKFSEKKTLDIWSGAPDGETTTLDILVAPDIKTSFKDFVTQYNISHSVAIEDYQILLNSQKIVQYLHKVEQSCPKLVKLLSIGKTSEKRRLWLVQISTARRGARRPFVLLDAGSHAREWIGPATALYIISRLLGEDCGATGLSKYLDWHIIPLFNPDGYEYTHTRVWNTYRREQRWLSISPIICQETGASMNQCLCYLTETGASMNQCLCYLTETGASLNQCLCYLTETGASLNPCQSDYAGPKPFSEPEARAFRNYVLSDAKRVLLYISLHSYGKKQHFK